MEAMIDQHRRKLDSCQEELQNLKTQHERKVEAVEQENRKLCIDIAQVNNLHTA